MSRLIILSAFATMLVAAGQQQFHFANFEDKHMQDTHGIQVNDEVAFFKIHDDNGDGFWDESDLRAMYGLERDIDPNAHHVRTIVDRALQDLDKDKDGKISLEEYMKSQLPDWTPEEIQEEKEWMDHHPPQTGTPKAFHHSDQPEWSEGDHEEEEQSGSSSHEAQYQHHQEGDFVPDKFKAN
ncbi:hypothetical protein BDA99DRAFT_491550 [Phascolomyces articulosus]|uniref:EF-hand domain-containing protein n=1 Tax=Phascolomyces articulosus TaxID=60185 RepID=A0AAD5KQM1_9FUNG|nr:hypothetical protein BDA99DRAFT_491550 [Phascolomyces articulosus]